MRRIFVHTCVWHTAASFFHTCVWRRAAEKKIEKLEPSKLKTYEELIAKSRNLQVEGQNKEAELEQMRHKVHELESIVRGGGLREEYNAEERRAAGLRKQIVALEEDMEIANLDPKDAHARLLAKVKEDNRKTVEMENRCKEIEEEMGKLHKQKKELVADLSDREKGNSAKNDSRKYELLFQRDAEMTQFLETYDKQKMDAIGDQVRTQATIVALLEHISTGINAGDENMSAEKLEEMKEEVTFKTKKLETSQQTIARLQEQRVKRVQEMDKINSLDEKIGAELKQLQEKITGMNDGMQSFEDIEGLRARATFTKDELEKLREKYISRRAAIKQQVAGLSAQVESNKKALAINETSKNLNSLEQKLRHYEQNIFSLKEYIETRGRETDFESLKGDVMKMVEQLNKKAVDSS